MARLSPAHITQALPGPTGESNTYSILPRARVLCLAASDADRLTQLAAVLAAGGQALWPAECEALHQQLPEAVQEHVSLVAQWQAESVWFDAVLHHGDADALRAVCQAVAQRPGPIVGVTGLPEGTTDIPLERLVHERSVSVNTAAAEGNASLMTIG